MKSESQRQDGNHGDLTNESVRPSSLLFRNPPSLRKVCVCSREAKGKLSLPCPRPSPTPLPTPTFPGAVPCEATGCFFFSLFLPPFTLNHPRCCFFLSLLAAPLHLSSNSALSLFFFTAPPLSQCFPSPLRLRSLARLLFSPVLPRWEIFFTPVVCSLCQSCQSVLFSSRFSPFVDKNTAQRMRIHSQCSEWLQSEIVQ